MNSINQAVMMTLKPSLRRAYFLSIIYAAIVAAARVRLALELDHPVVLPAVVILLAALLYAHVAWLFISYALTQNEVELHSGIIARSAIRIPLERISNLDVRQSILERLLGITNVYLDTPGSPGAEGCLRRVLTEDAQEFMDMLKVIKSKQVVPEQPGQRLAANSA